MKTIDNYKILSENGQLESIITTNRYEEDEISTELVNNEEGFDSLQYEWNRLVEISGAHVFQSFEWQRAWWKYFGGKNRLHIITFRSKGKLIGIAPFYLDKTSLFFKFRYWRLRLIGCSVPSGDTAGTYIDYSPSDYLDIIAAPEYETQIADIILLYLEKSGNQFNQVEFDEVPENSFIMRRIVPELEIRNWSFKIVRRETCPRINLPGSMKDYLLDLSGKARYELRYSKRAETEKKIFRVENANSEKDVREAFDNFVSLHQERWNRQGLPGAFANSTYTKFLEEITLTFYHCGWIRIKTVLTDDQHLAVDYAFAFNNRVYDYQKALDDTSPLSKYGPGKTLLYDLLEESIQEERTVVDLLRGDESYKLRFANDSRCNWKVTIPNCDEKKGILYRLYNVHTQVTTIFARVAREWIILKIHVKQGGLVKFIPHYMSCLLGRFKNFFTEPEQDTNS